jgi:hypothetical protein
MKHPKTTLRYCQPCNQRRYHDATGCVMCQVKKRAAEMAGAPCQTKQSVPGNYERKGSGMTKEEESESVQRENEWSKREGLKRSKAAPFCVCRLLGKRCSSFGMGTCPNAVPEADHPSLWLRDGKPVAFVSQPYQIGDVEKLGSFCRDRDLRCTITTWPAWHYPGNALFVEIRRAQETP